MPVRPTPTANRQRTTLTLSELSSASGLVVVDKPSGWTSHQVVSRCRRLLGTRKVGHAGTLDPMATGVLLVGANRATRLLGHLAGHDKSYQATIRLGIDTITDDAEGEVTGAPGAAALTPEVLLAAVQPFVGAIFQVPSAVSAIKVDGKRSYARVRAGEDVELAARQVSVSRFDVLGVRAETAATEHSGAVAVVDVDVIVDCSSGTYVRALARDLGRALGTGGHLTALRRTRVGGFDLSLVSLDAEGLAGSDRPTMLDLATVARRAFPVVELTADQARDVSFGRALALDVPADPTALLDGDQMLALYRPDGPGRAVPVAVLAG